MNGHILKGRFLKLGVSFLLLGVIMGAFVGQSAHAQGTCSQTSALIVPDSPPNASASCTVEITVFNPSGALALLSDPVATVTRAVTAGGSPTFTFTSTVADDRGTDDGWRLQASSTGLTGTGLSTVFPTITSVGTITPRPILTGGTCDTPTASVGSLPVPLSATPTTFLTSSPAEGAAIHCSYSFPTNGSIDFSSAVAGLYVGTITLTLVNAA